LILMPTRLAPIVELPPFAFDGAVAPGLRRLRLTDAAPEDRDNAGQHEGMHSIARAEPCRVHCDLPGVLRRSFPPACIVRACTCCCYPEMANAALAKPSRGEETFGAESVKSLPAAMSRRVRHDRQLMPVLDSERRHCGALLVMPSPKVV